MEKIRLGFCMTGSFCTFDAVLKQMEKLAEEYDIIPIMSHNTYNLDTRFGTAQEFIKRVEEMSGKRIIASLQAAEPIGPKHLTDLMLVAPCTGNTMAKLALSITDTPVTMAVKSHMRNAGPVILAVSTNDALSGSGKNIGTLMNYKNYYFVPFRQDNCNGKPTSMVADFSQIKEALVSAQYGKQIQPMILS